MVGQFIRPQCTREFRFQLKSYIKSWISSLRLVYSTRNNEFRILLKNNSVPVWFIACSLIYELIWTRIPTLFEVSDTFSARNHTAKDSSSVSSSESSSKKDAGPFLVAYTRLCKSLCRSVRPSVCHRVQNQAEKWSNFHQCPCPPVIVFLCLCLLLDTRV